MRCLLLLDSLSVAQSKQQFGRLHLLCAVVLQWRPRARRALPIDELVIRSVCVSADAQQLMLRLLMRPR